MEVALHQPKTWVTSLKMVLIFLIYSLAWIFFSDKLALILVKDPKYLTQLQTIKGFLYVGITSLILYGFLWKSFSNITVSKTLLANKLSLFAHTIMSISECVVITDLENKIVFVNQAFLKTYGYKKRELIGQNIELIRSHLTRPSVAKEILPASLNGGWQGILYNKKKDGTDFPVYLSTSMVTDNKNKPIALVGIAKDITEKKQLEEQLRQAQKLQGLGTLAGGIAHDFNNILGIIMGYASLIQQGKLAQKRVTWGLKSIIKATDRGTGLVQQILTFARKKNVLFEIVKVNSAVRDLVDMAKQTFPTNISFSLDLEDNLPFIKADHNQFHQVLLNICINARDAMPAGGNISIKTTTVLGKKLRKKFADAKENNYTCVMISDNGIGMDKLVAKRIFEPFFTTKKEGSGTGLGLSVVYGIISNHHGFVDVESEEGKGSTFYLYFPVADEEINLTVDDLINENKKENNGKETILLVEDEEMLLNVLKDTLKYHGYKVLTARNGKEAVELYSKNYNSIDLIFTDLGLPKLNGWQAYLEMKKFNPQAKVILASGYLDPKVKQDIPEVELKNFVQKPYRPSQILKQVRKVIDYSSN
jgi:PAS domain S-box-containing protein